MFEYRSINGTVLTFLILTIYVNVHIIYSLNIIALPFFSGGGRIWQALIKVHLLVIKFLKNA